MDLWAARFGAVSELKNRQLAGSNLLYRQADFIRGIRLAAGVVSRTLPALCQDK